MAPIACLHLSSWLGEEKMCTKNKESIAARCCSSSKTLQCIIQNTQNSQSIQLTPLSLAQKANKLDLKGNQPRVQLRMKFYKTNEQKSGTQLYSIMPAF